MSYFKYFEKVPYDLNGDGITKNLTNITRFVKIDQSKIDDIAYYSYYTIPDGYRPDNVSYELYGTTEYYWTFFLINDTLKNAYDDWPVANSQFQEWVENKHYGYAALTNDSLVSVFTLGERVQGTRSGATGTVTEIHPTTKWIRIEDITGTFNIEGEPIISITTKRSIQADTVTSAAYAPMFYTDVFTGEVVPKRVAGVQAFTFYEAEAQQQIDKSRIRVIKPEFIRKVAKDFIKEMRK
jgi:hypothetical protein